MNYDDPLVEHLAKIEHDQWAQWARTILDTEPGISKDRRERWEKLLALSYEELTEEWKEYDREWARKVLWRVGVKISDVLEQESAESRLEAAE